MLHIGGQGALTQHKMGSLQDLPHVDLMTPITKFAAIGLEHRARRGHDLHGGARSVQRRARSCVSGNSARRARSRGRHRQGGDTAARQVPRLHQIDRRPARHREAGRLAGQCRTARHSLRSAGVDRARPQGSDRAAARPRHPGLLQRRQPRPAAARRSASFRPHPQPGLRQAPTCWSSSERRSTSAWATANASARS